MGRRTGAATPCRRFSGRAAGDPRAVDRPREGRASGCPESRSVWLGAGDVGGNHAHDSPANFTAAVYVLQSSQNGNDAIPGFQIQRHLFDRHALQPQLI